VDAIGIGTRPTTTPPLSQLSELQRQHEVALHRPHIRADAVRLSELLHPCFREFGRSGREYYRAEVLAEFASDPQVRPR
jgi:hypothetical protein